MMKKLYITLGLLLFSLAACAQSDQGDKYKEGVHYFRIEQASAPAESDTVEVTEVFSYACPHCDNFEPYMQNWKKTKPAWVKLDRVPVAFGHRSWALLARGYVTAEMMGIAEMSHVPMMDAIWRQHKQFHSLNDLADFYSTFGVEKKEFIADFNSFAVDAKVRRDQRDVQEWGVKGTPTLIVNRKYRIEASKDVPTLDTMIDILRFLTEKEHNEAANKAGA